MDNDNKIKKLLASIYRDARFAIDYKPMGVKNEKDGNELIKEKILQGKPLMVCRFGAVEMRCVSRWMKQKKCSDEERTQALFAAGIFPNSDEMIGSFCSTYTEAIQKCDILGVWEVKDEKKAIKAFCPSAMLIPSRSIEPYYFENPWSHALEGKRVLIIHPFVESIKTQIQHRKEIWPEKEVLPEFAAVSYIKAVQSNAGGKTKFRSWLEALAYMEEMCSNCEFDIAIIGAGAYGLPLAAYIKSMGRQAIQMSGATQILFGIKGKRWDEHPVISKYYNDAWVRPLQSETPPEISKVEGGSYW